MSYDLPLHDSTAALLQSLATQPPQGVLFVGPQGIGKIATAQAWAKTLIDHETAMQVIEPDEKGTITIEAIRQLYKTTRARQQGRQVVIIDQADSMSIEAENAFLKLLEEPRPGLTFILIARQQNALLPTVLSRVQQVTFLPLADDAIRRYIMSKQPGISQNDLSQITFIAAGRPGVALELLADDALPKQRERMQLIKQLLTAKPYERFSAINQLAANRDGCLASLDAMQRVVELQLRNAVNKNQATRWIAIADALENALDAISRNGNIRAQLLLLFSSY